MLKIEQIKPFLEKNPKNFEKKDQNPAKENRTVKNNVF